MQKITPFLWFDNRAEEAAEFYTRVFKNARILATTHYNEDMANAAERPAGSVMTVEFEIEGQEFVALNGGPVFKFSPATSFVVNCETQDEVDYFWEKLSEGGETNECGWLTDKFGLSWQITPTVMYEMMRDPDAAKSQRAMKAMLGMTKLDIETLTRAYEGDE